MPSDDEQEIDSHYELKLAAMGEAPVLPHLGHTQGLKCNGNAASLFPLQIISVGMHFCHYHPFNMIE